MTRYKNVVFLPRLKLIQLCIHIKIPCFNPFNEVSIDATNVTMFVFNTAMRFRILNNTKGLMEYTSQWADMEGYTAKWAEMDGKISKIILRILL